MSESPITSENCGKRITDALMICVEWLGNFPEAKVDSRAWEHLSVYLPRIEGGVMSDSYTERVMESQAELARENAELKARLAAAEKDAGRYRVIRSLASDGNLPEAWTEGYSPPELDADIDAAKGE